MSAFVPRIAERDGRVARIVAGDVEVIAEIEQAGEEIILSRLSIDGVGPGSLGIRRIRELGRAFARSMGVLRFRIRGTPRTTGANSGKIPLNMYTVTLLSWSNGFVVNRLVALLREHRVGLAAAHDLASRLAEGHPSSVVFQEIEPAERFAGQAAGLGVQVAFSRAAIAAG